MKIVAKIIIIILIIGKPSFCQEYFEHSPEKFFLQHFLKHNSSKGEIKSITERFVYESISENTYNSTRIFKFDKTGRLAFEEDSTQSVVTSSINDIPTSIRSKKTHESKEYFYNQTGKLEKRIRVVVINDKLWNGERNYSYESGLLKMEKEKNDSDYEIVVEYQYDLDSKITRKLETKTKTSFIREESYKLIMENLSEFQYFPTGNLQREDRYYSAYHMKGDSITHKESKQLITTIGFSHDEKENLKALEFLDKTEDKLVARYYFEYDEEGKLLKILEYRDENYEPIEYKGNYDKVGTLIKVEYGVGEKKFHLKYDFEYYHK